MAYVKKRTVLPIYLVGFVWLLWAIFGQLYRPTHYIMAALASAVAYFVGKMIWPDRGYETSGAGQAQASAPKAEQARPREEKPKAEKPRSTGNPEIDALIKEREKAVSEMRRLNDSIEDPKISRDIDHLETVASKIIDTVVEKPAKLPQIRRFMNYYLPTTLKLLNAYDRMDGVGVAGANIDGTKGKIEDMMDTVCKAFDKQLDALYGEEALDISTDITVLENMLAQEGLGGTTFPG